MSRSVDSALLDPTVELLTSPHRRRVLSAVADRGPLDEAALVAALSRADEPGASDPVALRTALRYSHLPRLAERGYVAWDRDDGTVRRGPDFGEIEPRLRGFADR